MSKKSNFKTAYSDPLSHQYLNTLIKDGHHEQLLSNVLHHFNVKPGDTVIEIGAGFGRYTEWLSRQGIKVIATDVDLKYVDILTSRFKNHPNVIVLEKSAENLGTLIDGAQFICGFHILHHLTDTPLRKLAGSIEDALQKKRGFKGWFFLEPNGWNPLYIVQTLFTPAMKFAEERGIWLNAYQKIFEKVSDGSCFIGGIGLFPPRHKVSNFPVKIQNIGTSVSRVRSPFQAYSLYGSSVKIDAP